MGDVLDRSRAASLRQVENRVAALSTSSAIMSPVARRKGSPLVTSTSRKTARRERRDGVRPAGAVGVRGPRGPLRENVGGAPPNATRLTEQPPPASAGSGSFSSMPWPSPSAGGAPPPTPPPPPGDDEVGDASAAPRWSPHRARPGSAFAASGNADAGAGIDRPRGALSLTASEVTAGLVAPTSDVEGIGGEAWGAREEAWGARGALSVDHGRLFHSAPPQRIVGGWDRAAVSSTAFEAAPDPGLSLSTIESQGASEASMRVPAGAPSRRPRAPRDDEKLRRLREVVSRQRAERGGGAAAAAAAAGGADEPHRGEERAAIPVFSEPRLLAAKVRKVASAPPAPVYRGFNQAECSVRAPDGSVYREHEFRALARDPTQRHRFSLLLPSGGEGKAPARSPERAGAAPSRRKPVREGGRRRGEGPARARPALGRPAALLRPRLA
uniref:Skin secretory protein xP2-like n=1 Tax=Petromyzon marinus TaxID=7757 RepID=A0AAJ7XFE1_PETMA|nr:skin secretory protein xP2-like [Petromyzon marinus]XP_032832326.1 skin secretory protein xP2-like [Petromyzon marinus]